MDTSCINDTSIDATTNDHVVNSNEQDLARSADLHTKRTAVMDECKTMLEAAMTDVRETAKKIRNAVGFHVDINHKVLCEYDHVLKKEKEEMERLEYVSHQVDHAMNPFMMGGGGGSSMIDVGGGQVATS